MQPLYWRIALEAPQVRLGAMRILDPLVLLFALSRFRPPNDQTCGLMAKPPPCASIVPTLAIYAVLRHMGKLGATTIWQ